MSSVRDWLARRSGIELFFIYGGFFGLAMALIGPGIGLRIGIVGAVIAGVLFGAAISGMTMVGRKRGGGRDRIIQINSAIQSGELPGLIDPTAWLANLNLRLVSLRQSRITIPVIFGILVVVELATGFSQPRISYGFFVIAAFVALVATASVISNRRRIPKIEALVQKIREAYNLS